MKNTSDLKRKNALRIISSICKKEATLKPEIARLVGVTQVTAHNIINELAGKGLVMENGNAKSSGGRKPTVFKLNPSYGFILAQSITLKGITTGVFDFNLEPVYKNSVELYMGYSEELLDVMQEELENAAARSGYGMDRCFGLGVTVPGRVDPETGTVKNIVNLSGWKGVPLKSYLEDRMHVPIYINNDNNGRALAAKWLGVVREDSDLVFISITNGVGVGILTKGTLLQGAHANAGEIGHTTIDYKGPPCKCGNNGCIEIMTSYGAILAQANEMLSGHVVSDIKQVIDLAKEQHTPICIILERITEFIRILVDHVIKVYDPEVIVINSLWLHEISRFYNMLLDNLFEKNRFIKRDMIKIIPYTLTDTECVESAAIVMEELMEDIHGNLLLDSLGF